MKLTRKQKAFADHLINNPRDSATDAVKVTYKSSDYASQRAIASQNLTKPAIQFYLEEHVDKAKLKVVELINADKEEIQLRASESVLNRALGMPTQRTENHSTVVELNLNLKDITE